MTFLQSSKDIVKKRNDIVKERGLMLSLY